MQCDKIQEQLSAYLDNALSAAEKSAINDHLRACPKCRKALANLEMTVSSIKGIEEINPPPWLTQKVMARIKAEAEPIKRSLRQRLFYPLHIKLPIEAVGIFLIALTALYVFKSMEPEIKTFTAPSEEISSQYAEKGKDRMPSPKLKNQPQSPATTLSKKDETTADSSAPQERGQLPVPLPQQSSYDNEPQSKENHFEEPKALEKNMLMKSVPSPAVMSAPDELKQERAARTAGKVSSVDSKEEDISLSFRARDIDSAKRELEEVLSEFGGKVIKDELTSNNLIILGDLGSDKLLLFMQKLKILGYVKEKTPTPVSDKSRVLIKITVSKP